MTVVDHRDVGPVVEEEVRPGAARRVPGLRRFTQLPPSLRDGLALVLSNGLTSAVGLGYWVLAARLFPPEAVGINNVALSTMMLLGSVAQLNMTYALLRFVPVAGRATRRLVVAGYVVGATAAALAGAVFALGAGIWAPDLVEAAGLLPLLAFFVLAAPLWAIFVIQDFVLTGIRRATIVPGENFVFSLLKFALLVVAAVLAIPAGIAVSWVVSTALIVVAINGWLLLRALPQHARATADRAVPITVGGVARFVRADYAGVVFRQTAMNGLPVLVLARLGADAAAVFGIVWTIVSALYMVASSMNQSMVAHSSGEEAADVEAARRATVRQAMVLVGPAVAVLVVAAPLVLSVFGEHYADAGATTLMLLALSAVPNVVTSATVNAARVRQRMGVLVGVPATIALLVFAISWLLMPRLGILAVGVGWLVAQSLVAGGILVAGAPWLPPLLSMRIDAVRSAALLRRVRPLADTHADPDWVLGPRLSGRSGAVVVEFGPAGPSAELPDPANPTSRGALLKASDSPRGQAKLRRQTEVLAALHAEERLTEWHPLLPTVVGDGDVGGSYCVLESRLPGAGGSVALRDPARRRTFRSSAVATISEMHRCTAHPLLVDDATLRRWVHEPMAVVAPVLPKGLRPQALALAGAVAERLRGATVALAWTHGDFTADNVLTDDAGQVVAVVDWCDGDPDGFAVLDLVYFLLTADAAVSGQELGAVVLDRLADVRQPDGDLLTRAQRNLGGDVIGVGPLALLAWLQHVSRNIAKSPSYAANPVWVRRNLVAVVREARLS